ncbi:MAG: DoxX family membrane protein [Dehalococcoidia bacterium]
MFASRTAGYLWFFVRLYVGWQWLTAGWHKVVGASSVGWFHSGVVGGKPVHAGDKLGAFWQHAVAPPPPGGMSQLGIPWYRNFLQFLLGHHTQTWFAGLVGWGELLVGLALILGTLTAVAALVGALMSLNYMLAGSASLNPVLFLGALLLILAWRSAGYVGLDRWLLPLLGTPWQPGRLFHRQPHPSPVIEEARTRSRRQHRLARFVRRATSRRHRHVVQ